METGLLTMTEAQYRASEAISKSDIDYIAPPRTPAHYKAHKDGLLVREETPAMRLGTLTHRAILEPDSMQSAFAVRPDGLSFTTKEGKAWRDAQKAPIITQEEADASEGDGERERRVDPEPHGDGDRERAEDREREAGQGGQKAGERGGDAQIRLELLDHRPERGGARAQVHRNQDHREERQPHRRVVLRARVIWGRGGHGVIVSRPAARAGRVASSCRRGAAHRYDRDMPRSDAVRNYEMIVEVAEQLFAESGHDVPFSHVARRAGVGQGTLYRHFPTKLALISQIYQRRLDIYEAFVSEHDGERTILRDLLRQVAAHQQATPLLFQMLRAEVQDKDDAALVRALHERTAIVFGRALAVAQAAGGASEDLETEDVLVIVAMLLGAANSPTADSDRADAMRRGLAILERALA